MKFSISILFILLSLCSKTQVTIVINNPFHLTPLTDTLYLAGDMNSWAEHDPAYAFQRTGFNSFEITFTPAIGTMNYKITRGSWATVESNAYGTYLANRTLNYTGSATSESLQILGWEDIGGNNTTSATDNTHLLDLDFYIPNLNRFRRIWIYLPPDYHTTSKEYPVVYMQDAQNLFDQTYAPFGEWEVDESMNDLFYNQGDYGAIVVGIDHGDIDRINEYSPWVNSGYGGGQGDEYMNFMAQTLVPYIDAHFRTLANADSRALIGSSMGGLISQYGVIEHKNTFLKGGIMSPAFWFSNNLYSHVHAQGIHPNMKFYFVSGTNESSSMVPLMMQMEDSLTSLGLDPARIEFVTHTDGQHSEWFWAREFPAVYTWLFNDLVINTSTKSDINTNPIKLYPNPSHGKISILNTASNQTITIFNALQQVVYQNYTSESKTEFLLPNISKGLYVVQISNGKTLVREKFILE